MKIIRAVILTVTILVLYSRAVFADGPLAAEAEVQGDVQCCITSEMEYVPTEEGAPQAEETATTEEPETQKLYKAYECTDDEIRWIAAVAINENGSSEKAIRYEVSLICNLADMGRNGRTPCEVANSNWFAKATKKRARKTVVSDEIYNITADVLSGHRATDCNEHDCLSDIVSITTNGVTFFSKAEIKNIDNYVSGVTVITNRYGASYLFECFPAADTDPFGIL